MKVPEKDNPSSSPIKMPHARAWLKELSKRFDKETARDIIENARTRHRELFESRQIYSIRAFRYHLEYYILPSFALYQALQDGYQDKETAFKTVEELVTLTVLPLRRIYRVMGILPFFFSGFKWGMPYVMKWVFPPEGWETEWVESSEKRIAFDIHGCFVLERLKELRAPELTPVFCNCDDVMFENLSSTFIWRRTKTLGRGDDCCNFRFIKTKY